MNDFISIIESFDQRILIFINSLNNPFLDKIMWIVSSTGFGFPFYILFIVLLIKTYNIKQVAWLIIVLLLVVSLCDLSAKYCFKEVFQRYRPSHNLLLKDKLHLINNYSGGKYGFVSSHASNMAGISTMIYLLLKHSFKKLWYLLIPFVLLICYSRVYLGVHYISDIIVGMFLGFFISLAIFKLINKINLVKL